MTTNAKTKFSLSKLILTSSLIISSYNMLGCANTAEGAGTGALAGAAGGLVSGLIWGGDPLESAARGAAVGAASGAVVGAVQGSKESASNSEATTPSQPDSKALPSKEQLVALIGEPAVDGIVALAQCDYSSALSNANIAFSSTNPNHKEAGIWVQALTYAETGEVEKLNASYADIIKLDKEVNNVLEAQSELAEGLDKLKAIREEHQLPTSCS
ncbi:MULTISPECIES: glycine zipper family protein [unclassified Agarivorans]|uniref:glycine zipper family protein n=1 Tax=unclassified Agarivorans TaxID=2636026 RepID=UPI0026E16F2A|nr:MULTISPECIES: glycine zipper family protein [unclassified Agarivorans]MDO6686279.1 glycine zipper family protein [Agarivorans sp. 3_MG-2023]MDO6716272.1 glycine zipper family protein [Agarivorans sp. 2_MG-2023]